MVRQAWAVLRYAKEQISSILSIYLSYTYNILQDCACVSETICNDFELGTKKEKKLKKKGKNQYILLDGLLCSIAEYFYELCRKASQNANNV